jgi:hypothetical protein
MAGPLRPWLIRVSLAAAAVAAMAAACPGPGKKAQNGAGPRASGDLTLFMTAELMGSLEPCGCTSDPLGYLERTAAQVDAARRSRPTALLDGGSTLYAEPPMAPEKRPQEELEAGALAKILPTMALSGIALGPTDLADGAEGVRLARQAANVTAGAAVEPPRVLDLGGVKVGVFGVVAPELVASLGVKAGEAAPAARAAIAALRQDGAQIVVALAHMDRAAARRLVKEAPGADLVLVGHDVPELGAAAPEKAGDAFLFVPGKKGQVVLRVDVHVDAAGGALVDAIGPARARGEIAKLDAKTTKLEADLARWAADPSADAAFVEGKRKELAALKQERAELEARPLRAPEAGKGSWFTVEAIPINKRLPCDPAVVAAKGELDKAIGEANLAAAKGETVPPVPAGKAGFVGSAECAYCHKPAVELWSGTRHAGAWATLEKANKQFNRDCIGCHLTGWNEPGGAVLTANEHLRDVQCETCHGPGSLHVDADGKEKPKSMVLNPPQDLCASRCHTPEHSDTFDYTPYLRDIVGKGHGEKLRAKLGDGPTGRELRSTALEKAGREIGAGCPK